MSFAKAEDQHCKVPRCIYKQVQEREREGRPSDGPHAHVGGTRSEEEIETPRRRSSASRRERWRENPPEKPQRRGLGSVARRNRRGREKKQDTQRGNSIHPTPRLVLEVTDGEEKITQLEEKLQVLETPKRKKLSARAAAAEEADRAFAEEERRYEKSRRTKKRTKERHDEEPIWKTQARKRNEENKNLEELRINLANQTGYEGDEEEDWEETLRVQEGSVNSHCHLDSYNECTLNEDWCGTTIGRGLIRIWRKKRVKWALEACLEMGYEGDEDKDKEEESGVWEARDKSHKTYLLHHEEAQHRNHTQMNKVKNRQVSIDEMYRLGEARGKQRKLRRRLEKKEIEDTKERIVEDLNKCQLPRQYRLSYEKANITGRESYSKGETPKGKDSKPSDRPVFQFSLEGLRLPTPPKVKKITTQNTQEFTRRTLRARRPAQTEALKVPKKKETKNEKPLENRETKGKKAKEAEGITGSSAKDVGDTGKIILPPYQKSMETTLCETTLYEETESSWNHVENMANDDKDAGQNQDEQDHHQTQVKQEQSKQASPLPPEGEWIVPIGAQDDDRTRQKGRQKQ